MALCKRMDYDEVEGARFGRFNLADNSTAIVYRIGDTIIDTGPPNQWAAVKNYLSEKPIRQVILTHHHEDHSGNAAPISRRFQVPVYIDTKGIRPVSSGFPLKPYQRFFWGRPRPFTPQTMPETIRTGRGHTLVPISTPGHAPDHVCLLEPDRKWLFSGDLFLATRPKLFRADEDLEGEIQSLMKIAACDFNILFCAHKGVVQNGRDRIREKRDYFVELVDTVKKMHAQGQSVKDITRQVFGRKNFIGKISFNHICSENLIRQCLAVDEGKYP